MIKNILFCDKTDSAKERDILPTKTGGGLVSQVSYYNFSFATLQKNKGDVNNGKLTNSCCRLLLMLIQNGFLSRFSHDLSLIEKLQAFTPRKSISSVILSRYNTWLWTVFLVVHRGNLSLEGHA